MAVGVWNSSREMAPCFFSCLSETPWSSFSLAHYSAILNEAD